jgi:hypothetical protein
MNQLGQFDQKRINATKIAAAFGITPIPTQPIKKAFKDELEKGEVSDLIAGYGSPDTFKFTKKGSEILANLDTLSANLAAKVAGLNSRMTTLETAIGEAPTEDYTSYTWKTVVVKRYAWGRYYSNENSKTTTIYPVDGGGNTEPALLDKEQCNAYNDCSYTLRSLMEDLEAVRILKGNIEPKKSYTLTTKQLITLGF